MFALFGYWIHFYGTLLLVPFLVNYSEAKIGEYILPGIFTDQQEQTIDVWEQERRQKLVELFETYVYGAYPKERLSPAVEVLEEGDAFDGQAKRRQVQLSYEREGYVVSMRLLMYTPSTPGPHPVIVAYNFEGNHSLTSDGEVIASNTHFIKSLPGLRIFDEERRRGKRKERLPIQRLIQQGIAITTLYYGDVDPDFDDHFQNGFHGLYPEYTKRADYAGAISAWAWGLSRVADYLEEEEEIDPNKIGLFGFSRLGKAALWAAANDNRFKVIVADSSGIGGAGLARRNYGETIRLVTARFPHWFTGNYRVAAGHEEDLPIDQHQLVALLAPRPVLIAAATKDKWSDPDGEKEAVEVAKEVYGLYNSKNLEYIKREGAHAVTTEEWSEYTSFFKKHL